VTISENKCIVFKNAETIKHRAVITTDNKCSNGSGTATRKLLSFFLINPDSEIVNEKSSDCKWYNYPMKTNIFVNHFLDYDMDFIDGISVEIVALIGYFIWQ